MLVLSRHRNEAIVLSGGIRIMVVDIRGDKVRIGIKAPDGVVIMRDELLGVIDPETRLALGVSTDATQAKA